MDTTADTTTLEALRLARDVARVEETRCLLSLAAAPATADRAGLLATWERAHGALSILDAELASLGGTR